MKFIIRILVIAAISYGLSRVLNGIHVADFWTAIIFAVVLAILSVFIKPILVILTLPVTILTLGLFLFVINTIIVLLASEFVRGFTIDNFWWGLLFSLLLSLIASFLNRELDRDKSF
ncbi:MAG TPA: phage holin family protein [Chitinophagaceae bacterium]|nr:phage holin family protein [Chitinophagaceae bacterium]